MNKCLISKWIWKLENSEGIWQDVVRAKYLQKNMLSQELREVIILISGRGLLMFLVSFTASVEK
jgi:hypothetical protein